MAALPSPTQVAGNHSAIYEAYYNQVDPNGSGVIQALDAARFLKKSKLSDVILSKVWDLSDPSGRGYLDKGGLFVALKLVALAQSGKEIAMSNINSETPPPKLGELPKVPPTVPPPPTNDWSVKPAERDKYNQLFDSLQPSNGLIPGNKVKGVLMESKLPLPTLGKIWDLADQDKDGMLDRHEFIVAMHLVYKALEKHTIPAVLPPELRAPSTAPHGGGAPPRPPSRPPSRPASPSPARPPPPRPQPVQEIHPIPINNVTKSWVVTPAEKQQYDTLFIKADMDMDGFVSGMEIKDTFLQSGLSQPCLAHIWGLCDWDSSGKLSADQFALAMWMVQRKLRGIEPPAALAPDMIPPSASTPAPPPSKEPSLGPQPTPEMEALARDMEQLARERLALEAEVSAKELSIRAKTNEANSLQSELDTLAATLKQLENQRGEAQKRLNDLQAQVEKLRAQAVAQESVVSMAESEAASRREAAQGLRRQEEQLTQELTQHNLRVDALNAELQKSVLAISQTHVKLTHLEEQERRGEEAVQALDAALAGGPAPSPLHLQLQPPPSQQDLLRLVQGSEDGKSPVADGFGSMNGTSKDDPFKDDPFSSKTASNDPFAAAFPTNKSNDAYASDPFTSNFGSSTPDPFGGDAFSGPQDNKNKADDSKDPFGCDPFAILHAPTRDGSSPTPSLPPKKHKQPPPRPAPPRPAQPPSQQGFNADFGAFNNKLPSKSQSAAFSVSPQPKQKSRMDFTEDPFRDYRYEDPFNLDDPFADVSDSKLKVSAKSNQEKNSQESFVAFNPLPPPKTADINKNTSFAAFETDDFFATSKTFEKNNNDAFGGRQSVPLPSADPFSKSGRVSAPIVNNANNASNNNNQSWAAWGGGGGGGWADSDDNWATTDGWADTSANSNNSNTSKSSSGQFNTWSLGKSKTEVKVDKEKKKEKSPKPAGKSFTQTLGNLGRHKNKNKNVTSLPAAPSAPSLFPSEEQQLAWAAAEGRRLEEERRQRREEEDKELQIAMALSIRNQ